MSQASRDYDANDFKKEEFQKEIDEFQFTIK